MDEKIDKFFRDLGIPKELQVGTRPEKVSAGQIMAAMEVVYNRRDSIEPIMYVREARTIAKEIDVMKYRGTNDLAMEVTTEIGEFRKEVKQAREVLERALGNFEKASEGIERATWLIVWIISISFFALFSFVVISQSGEKIWNMLSQLV